MSLKAVLAPQLPYLRRYARALTGSQTLGDGAVREVLEALLVAPEEFDAAKPPRLELYRVFHRLWLGMASIGRDEAKILFLNFIAVTIVLIRCCLGFGCSPK